MSVTVYIDGQNFLYGVSTRLQKANIISDKQDITSIDIRGLLEPLFHYDDLNIRYYGVKHITCPPSLPEEINARALHFSDSLRRLRNYLDKNGVEYVQKGSLKARPSEPCPSCGYSDYHFREKGVDVGLAIDLVSDVVLGRVEEIALLSSDADLLPALQLAKSRGVKVTYISFFGQVTTSLIKIADNHVTLEDADIRAAFLRSMN